MTKIYVLDTETTTTFFRPVPNGHVVEIGIAEVDLDNRTVTPFYDDILTVTKMVKGKKKIDPEAWVFRKTSLTVEQVESGKDPSDVSAYLADKLCGCEVTAFNQAFDSMMIQRDLPQLSYTIRWGQDLMVQADLIDEIPRNKPRPCYPNAENTYNTLCKDDPCHLEGKEEHRALSDAMMEGHILLALYDRGLYKPIEPPMRTKNQAKLDFIHRNMVVATDLVHEANQQMRAFMSDRDISHLETANDDLDVANQHFYTLDKHAFETKEGCR